MQYPDHIDLSVPCREWTRAKNDAGYGVILLKGVAHLAHRVSYSLEYGELGRWDYVCHACDNPACYEPRHLFKGTPADNMTDMADKNRQVHGEDHPSSKLTEEQVKIIKASPLPQAELARKYGVSRNSIWSIKNGKTWNGA